MDKEFNERIYPSAERVILSIEQFLDLGLVHIISKNDKVYWNIDPIQPED